MNVIGIMQPYVFPYIGYYQLLAAVDKFIVYDDVTYIKNGWISRNNILVNNKPFLFTIPLDNPSSFGLIRDTKINQKFYPIWKEKFYKTIIQNYRKAPFFEETKSIIESVLEGESQMISDLGVKSIVKVADYLNIDTEIVETSQIYSNSHLKAQDRVVDICIKEKGSHYINPIGGQQLYSKSHFESKSLKLDFIKSCEVVYPQFKGEFVPWLSIIDVLMFNSKEKTNDFLACYELI